MNNIKAICVDLDGTLLDNSAHLSAENSAAISELSSSSVLVVPTTGRTFGEIPNDVRSHPDVRYLIYSNGAVILDKTTGEQTSVLIDEETYSKAMSILNKYKTMTSFHYQGQAYTDPHRLSKLDDYRVTPYFKSHFIKTSIFLDDHQSFFAEPRRVEMIVAFFAYDDEMQSCIKELSDLGLYVTSSEYSNIEILAMGAQKGDGLCRLAQKVGCGVDSIMAVGDSRNDISLLKVAGVSLAMENAHEDLKPYADAIACKNTEHIAKFIIEKYIRS